MTYINTEFQFNKARLIVSKMLISDKKIYNVSLGEKCWAPSARAVMKKPPNYRPLQCFNPTNGQRFTTDYEAREFVSKILSKYKCTKEKTNDPHWELNIRTGDKPAFSFFERNFNDPLKSLYIKFNLRFINLTQLNFYILEVFSFKPSEYKATVRQKN